MNVLVLTGAGISAESGIPTFRDANGLWEGHRFEDVATPQAFERDPVLVHQFYNLRRRALLDPKIQPNGAHRALAEFEHDFTESSPSHQFLLVTQNIDDLHQRAGSRRVLPMHGELLKARCIDSGEQFDWREDLSVETPHPHPQASQHSQASQRRGRLRPHVVWFGEIPLGLEQIEQAASQADVFVAIGTSAVVYPAAGIVQTTRRDCLKVEINLDATPQSSTFDESIRGPASQTVPQFFAELLARCEAT